MSEHYTPDEIEFWIAAYRRDLHREKEASESLRRSWRMTIAALRLLLAKQVGAEKEGTASQKGE